MKCLVTGATGFMGSSVVRELLADGQEVSVFLRKTSDTRNIDGLEVQRAYGDLRDYASVEAAMRGCSFVYHVGAMVAFWLPRKQRQEFYEVNVQGTKNILAAAQRLGVERVVYTSTIATIGSFGKDNPTTEEHSFNLWNKSTDYERSKYSAEFEVWRYAARGVPVVAVLPTAPVGARDIGPNPIGQLILDFLGRKLPGYLDGGANFIDVEDVARGHLAAAKKGKIGERYIIGAENLSVVELLRALESVSGIKPPQMKLPYSVSLGLAHALQLVSDFVTNRPPMLTANVVKGSSAYYFVDTSKAREELGFQPRSSVKHAAAKAIKWFIDNNYISAADGTTARIRDAVAPHLAGESV